MKEFRNMKMLHDRCVCCGKFRKQSELIYMIGENDEEWLECKFCMSESDREKYFKTLE